MELADVFRQHWESYARKNSPCAAHYKIANAIQRCRTAVLGGHILRCDTCGKLEISYNSCRNRHCPKCQGSKAAKWVTEREQDLLPVGYFHTVFTIPSKLKPLFQMAPREMYNLLFKAVSKTLLQVGERNLGCKIGAICVLHSWGSSLTLHPHIHCLIPGCGIKTNGKAVRFKKKRYFVPDKILSKVFQGKFITLLKKTYRRGDLPFHFDDIDAFLNTLVTKGWVTKTQPPFRGPSTVFKYLARYTHRVAISNRRILNVDANSVTFSYKNYHQEGTTSQMTLHPHEFIRRFLQHSLPHHFITIRHYGFLARQNKQSALALFRAAFGSVPIQTDSNTHKHCCPHCKQGILIAVAEIVPVPRLFQHAFSP